MIDRFLLKFFGGLDNIFSWLETYSIKLTTWLWQSRVKLLNKKRKTKVIVNVHPYDQDDYNIFVNTEIGQKLLNKVWKKHYSEMKEKNILESVAQVFISNNLMKEGNLL